MNAIEKIENTLREFVTSEPADAQTAMLQEVARSPMAAGAIGQYLGADPATVDRQLAGAALFVLTHRSDDADALVTPELLRAAEAPELLAAGEPEPA